MIQREWPCGTGLQASGTDEHIRLRGDMGCPEYTERYGGIAIREYYQTEETGWYTENFSQKRDNGRMLPYVLNAAFAGFVQL